MPKTSGDSRPILSADWQVATPPQLSASYGIAVAKTHRWIDNGELSARNFATSTSSRPVWRIFRADWEAFLASRASKPAAQAAPRRKRTTSAKEYV